MSPRTANLVSLRISEVPAEVEDLSTHDTFAAALLDAGDEYRPKSANGPRTLGRSVPLLKEEHSPAALKKLRKLEERLAAEQRKIEVEQEKLAARAAAEQKRLDEKAAAAQRKEDERLAALRNKEDARAAAEQRRQDAIDAAQRAEEERQEAKRRARAQRKGGILSRVFSWLRSNRAFGVEKQLRLGETITLGEKRFVAILHVEGKKFLIGGGASGISLLTALDAPAPADSTLEKHEPTLPSLSTISIAAERLQ